MLNLENVENFLPRNLSKSDVFGALAFGLPYLDLQRKVPESEVRIVQINIMHVEITNGKPRNCKLLAENSTLEPKESP